MNVGFELIVADRLGILSFMLTGDSHCGDESAALGRGHQLLGQFLDQRLFLIESFASALQRRRVFAALRCEQHVHHRTDEHERRGEHVDPDTGDERCSVVTHQFDPEPPDAVGGHIEREQSAVAEAIFAVDVDQQREHQQVPQQLVKKCRMNDGRDLPGRHAIE